MYKLFKYGSVTLISYLCLLLGTYVAVDILGFRPTIAYPVVLTLVYMGVYFASAFFVFKATHHKRQSPKYILAVIVFWLLNIALYDILVSRLDIQYLLSVFINVLVFGPLRYIVYNRLVFTAPAADSATDSL